MAFYLFRKTKIHNYFHQISPFFLFKTEFCKVPQGGLKLMILLPQPRYSEITSVY